MEHSALVGFATSKPIALDPDLAKYMAEYREAAAAHSHYDTTVYHPAYCEGEAAFDAARAAVPHHTTVTSFENMFGSRVHLSTKSEVSVKMARLHLTKRTLSHETDEYDACCRELVEAADRRQEVLDSIKRDPSIDALSDQLDEMGEVVSAHLERIEAFLVLTAHDLIAKLEFFRDVIGDSQIDIAPVIADLRRIQAGGEA